MVEAGAGGPILSGTARSGGEPATFWGQAPIRPGTCSPQPPCHLTLGKESLLFTSQTGD